MRFTLSKSEILRGYKSFTRVITTGKSISAPPIRCYFIRSVGSPHRIQAGFSVSRNVKRAVDRNRAKRLMRESYRLSKHAIANGRDENSRSLDIVFMYVGSRSVPPGKLTFEDVGSAMQKLISMLSSGTEE